MKSEGKTEEKSESVPYFWLQVTQQHPDIPNNVTTTAHPLPHYQAIKNHPCTHWDSRKSEGRPTPSPLVIQNCLFKPLSDLGAWPSQHRGTKSCIIFLVLDYFWLWYSLAPNDSPPIHPPPPPRKKKIAHLGLLTPPQYGFVSEGVCSSQYANGISVCCLKRSSWSQNIQSTEQGQLFNHTAKNRCDTWSLLRLQ